MESFINSIISFQPPFLIKLAAFFITIISILLIFKFRRRTIDVSSFAQTSSETSEDVPNIPSVGVVARWEEITRHVKSSNEAEWKMAVIEADKLMEDIFKEIGIEGDTLGEKMMSITSAQLTTINSLWEAHKMRNKLIHDSSYVVRDIEARRIIDLYELTLRELEAI